MNYRSIIYDDKLKHWKLLLYFHLQVNIITCKYKRENAHFQFQSFALAALTQIKATTGPIFLHSAVRFLLLRVACEGSTGFQFLSMSAPCSLARPRDVWRTVCKRGEISGAVWKKVQRRTNSSRAEGVHSADGVFGTVYKEAPVLFFFFLKKLNFAGNSRTATTYFIWRLFSWLGESFFFFYAGCTARNTSRWTESQVGLSGSWFCRNVAWRETQVLSTGSQ